MTQMQTEYPVWFSVGDDTERINYGPDYRDWTKNTSRIVLAAEECLQWYDGESAYTLQDGTKTHITLYKSETGPAVAKVEVICRVPAPEYTGTVIEVFEAGDAK